ncbi:Prolactin regulatory element-binding protein [Geodia barretti]|uniref:Prolactin regulatory element-binding protein n=1 Tax=Geodia barretti TaxID=519541 RepID=A0AA35TBI4_GEOBA|nr:Prolactin regulatory element-binding protein [Geodia barretti]
MTQNRDSHKKESKVKRRKKSKSDEEDSGVSKVVVSREVVMTTRTQTDFSSECYQKTVAFSCHGDRVVTGGSDGIVRVWKYPSLDKVCELKGHENEIETLSCHPSKEQVVSMCRGGKGVVWDLVNEDQEHWFTWTPGQLHTRPSEAKPTYRFRACWYIMLDSVLSYNNNDFGEALVAYYPLLPEVSLQRRRNRKNFKHLSIR